MQALEQLEATRPKIVFPDNFHIGISTNDPGLNLTEVIYYVSERLADTMQDSKAAKLRMQFYYSILGLEPTKGFDLVLDESKKMVAVQSDVDCKRTHFGNSLLPVSLFFSMFDALTQYRGIEDG